MPLRDWFQSKKDLVWQVDKWRKRALANEEHIHYWQEVSAYYRKKWDESLKHVPSCMLETLMNDEVKEYRETGR